MEEFSGVKARVLLRPELPLPSAAGPGASGASTVRGDIASAVNSLPWVVEVGPSKSVLAG